MTRIPKFASLVCVLLTLSLILIPSSISHAAPTALTTVDSVGGVGLYTSLALNASGNAVISYRDNSNGDLKLAVCNDAACSAPTLQTVDYINNMGLFTSLALNSSGFPVISYFDAYNFDLKLAVCNDATCATRTLTTVDNSAADVGRWDSLALNSAGNAVISYWDTTNGALMLAVCNDATCTAPTITVVDGVPGVDVGSFTSLRLNSSGIPVISYYDATNGDLKLAVCNNATCTAPTLTVVDSTNNVGQYTSLVLNAAGNAVISYRNVSNGDLKLAVCNNAACTAPTITIVDNVGSGMYPSLTLNASGFPVISYFDNSPRDLRLATCNDAACTSRTLATIDSAGTVGQWNSLALGTVTGFPIISYYDATNGDLKLAVCGNVTCTPEPVFSGTPAVPGPLDMIGPAGTPASTTFAISNTGNAGSGLTVSLNSITGGYSIAGGLPVTALQTTDSASSVTVQCDDPATSPATGTLVLTTNDTANPTVTYNLTCAVSVAPGFTKTFSPNPVASGSPSTLTFTINNSASIVTASALDFTDNLPAGLTVATPANASTTCTGGTLTATPGTGVISYTGGSVAAGATCTLQVDVAASAGNYVNLTGALTSSSGNSGTTIATLGVTNTLTISKTFINDPVDVHGGTVTLEFVLSNGNSGSAVTGLSFSDDLSAALADLTATGLPLNDVCGAGSQLSGSTLLTLTGGSLGAGANCTFRVTLSVPPAAAGDYSNSTSAVTGDYGGLPVTGNAATDDLLIQNLSAPSPGGPAGSVDVFDPAISKLGYLTHGQSGVQGEQIEWVISVYNSGAVAGNNVAVSDTLDSSLHVTDVKAPNGTVQINGQTVTVTFSTLAPGASAQFSIFTTTLNGTAVSNTACVTGGRGEVCTTAEAVRALPGTGESPWWRNGLLFAALSILALLAVAYGVRLSRR